MNPVVGQEYNVLDFYGMVTHKMKYLGTGYQYHTIDGYNYYKTNDMYYVFEKCDGNYKYAACEPKFKDCKFNCFQVIRYGNHINYLFVNFRQLLFEMGDEHLLTVNNDEFNMEYSKSKANSGSDGYFSEKV